MKPKTHVLLGDCIENGVRRGWHRAHKHNEAPTEETIFEEIENSIMSEINEYFTFEEAEYRGF